MVEKILRAAQDDRITEVLRKILHFVQNDWELEKGLAKILRIAQDDKMMGRDSSLRSE